MADDAEVPLCHACNERALHLVAEQHRGLCDLCSRNTGIWVGAPDLRPAVPCPRCAHTRFIRAQLRERSASTGESTTEYLAPLAVSFAIRTHPYPATARNRALPQTPFGIIVAYVCEGCGFTELYTLDPHKIPIGPQYGTDIVDVAAARTGPFR